MKIKLLFLFLMINYSSFAQINLYVSNCSTSSDSYTAGTLWGTTPSTAFKTLEGALKRIRD